MNCECSTREEKFHISKQRCIIDIKFWRFSKKILSFLDHFPTNFGDLSESNANVFEHIPDILEISGDYRRYRRTEYCRRRAEINAKSHSAFLNKLVGRHDIINMFTCFLLREIFVNGKIWINVLEYSLRVFQFQFQILNLLLKKTLNKTLSLF